MRCRSKLCFSFQRSVGILILSGREGGCDRIIMQGYCRGLMGMVSAHSDSFKTGGGAAESWRCRVGWFGLHSKFRDSERRSEHRWEVVEGRCRAVSEKCNWLEENSVFATYDNVTGVVGPLVLLFEESKLATALDNPFVDFIVVIPLISPIDPSVSFRVDKRIDAFGGSRDLVFPKFSSTYFRCMSKASAIASLMVRPSSPHRLAWT